ncbi:MAG: hypothetical protein HKO70_01850 [Acidimicrobiia bacterium]|nr:hypothetical protein [Acidimicrobiia bacterium]
MDDRPGPEHRWAMSIDHRRRLIRAMTWAAVATLVVLVTVVVVVENNGLPLSNVEDSDGLGVAILGVLLPGSTLVLGALALRNDATNNSGFLLLGFSLLFPWQGLGEYLVDWALVQGEVPRWIGQVGALGGLVALPGAWAIVAVFLLTFPTGRHLSRRWTVFTGAAVSGFGMLTLNVFNARLLSNDRADVDFFYAPATGNPLAIDAIPRSVFDTLFGLGIFVLFAALFGGLFSLIVRYFRARGEERQQLKVVAFAILGYALMAFIAANLSPLGGAYRWFFETGAPALVIVIPAAFAVALLKYRLYDIDVVINKAIVYGALVAFISAVYAGIVVLPLVLLDGNDRSGDELGLALLATVILVLVIQPVRDRLQSVANRLVYGRRATPYESLSDFSARVASAVADEELLVSMAEILAGGTGASRAAIWLVLDDELHAAAEYPESGGDAVLALARGRLPDIPDATAVAPVTHTGQLLGALSVTKSPGDPMRPIEQRLLEDLAAQAGVVLRNFRLNDELRRRLVDLQASRQRLVAAQDEERRKLERNLHDGAQQQLVALKIKLGLLGRVADDASRTEMVRDLVDETDAAIDSLRDLARGIYPPILDQEGLATALTSRAAKVPVPTEVRADEIGRYVPEVEAAVFFCVLEAMQNVAKYAGAARIVVRLTSDPKELRFEVADDGGGFAPDSTRRGAGLQNMEDRLEALGGSLSISSEPGRGTTVIGTVPAVPLRETARV